MNFDIEKMKKTSGNRIKELRTARNKTQAELATILHIGDSTVRMWEIGKSTPRFEPLIMMSVYFGVSTDYILGLSDKPTNGSMYGEHYTIHQADLTDGDQVTYGVIGDAPPLSNEELIELRHLLAHSKDEID